MPGVNQFELLTEYLFKAHSFLSRTHHTIKATFFASVPPDVLHNLQVTVSRKDQPVAGFHAGQHCHSNQKRCIFANGTSASRAAAIIRAPPEA